METTKKTKRTYRKSNAATIARFQAAVLLTGNGAAAVRMIEPEQRDEYRRAWLLSRKAKALNSNDYIDEQLQQIGAGAVERLGELIYSTDERIATKNVHYAIDHIRGKALQRSESKHMSLNIQTVLE